MSNTWLNIRFGVRHLQCVYLNDWLREIQMGRSPITFRVNSYQEALRINCPESWRWFKVHEISRPWW